MQQSAMMDWLRSASSDPTITVDGEILPLAIKRHPTARRLILRLAPDGSEVRVTMPQWGTTKEALAFAHSRSDWLTEQKSRIAVPCSPLDDGFILFRGQELTVDWQTALPRTPKISDDRIMLGGPQDTVTRRLQRWLERQAIGLMERDLAEYCGKAGIVPVPPLRLSRAQRRWGSCSSKGTVRINWRLIQAPDNVRRSVVAHEVAHLTHFDHSPAFYAQLAALFGDELPAADRWLKSQGRSLYAAFG